MAYDKKRFDQLAKSEETEFDHSAGQHLVCPMEFTEITKDLAKSGIFKSMKEHYSRRSLATNGCMLLLNSGLTQLRLVLVVSGSILNRAVMKDPNMNRNSPLNSHERRQIMSEFYNRFGKQLRASEAKTEESVGSCGIIEITDPIVRRLVSEALGQSAEDIVRQQLAEAEEFIQKYEIGKWSEKLTQFHYSIWIKKFGTNGLQQQLDSINSIAEIELRKIVTILHDKLSGNERGLDAFLEHIKLISGGLGFDISYYVREIWNMICGERLEKNVRRIGRDKVRQTSNEPIVHKASDQN